MRKINLNIIFRRFKALSLLICIFVLFGCCPHNTGEKHTLIVSGEMLMEEFNDDEY
jgi:hypothetical protein